MMKNEMSKDIRYCFMLLIYLIIKDIATHCYLIPNNCVAKLPRDLDSGQFELLLCHSTTYQSL